MNNIIRFYIFNNKLKKRLRQGWLDVKISSERIESVAEHIHGCLILAITINEEFKLNLNIEKILKMLTIHETEEIIIGDYSFIANISKEERLAKGREAVKHIVSVLINEEEITNIIEEFNEKNSKEAKFAYYIDKIECDFQAKIYDLEGNFDIENAKQDCMAWCGERAKKIIDSSNCASDIWLASDRYVYNNDELFLEIQNAIKKITKEEYDAILEKTN